MNCGESWPPTDQVWSRKDSDSSSWSGGLGASLPRSLDSHFTQGTARNGPRDHTAISEAEDQPRPLPLPNGDAPQAILAHRLRHNKSILVLLLTEVCVYAGTQAGEILVYSLETYELLANIQAHKASVLGLCISDDGTLLFSTAGDRIVNVWDTTTFSRRFLVFSTYDVGDIFCISYSSSLETFYIGLQNTAIQWQSLRDKDSTDRPTLRDHPLWKENHPFYDSAGPGGVRTPRPADEDIRARDARGGQALEIPQQNIHHFAHYGYVFCMLLATDTFTGGPPGQVLITGGGDGIINLWALDGDQEGAPRKLFGLEDDREEGQSVLSIAIDGTFLYAGKAQGEVNVWDLETKQLVRSLRSHRDGIISVCVGEGLLFSASVTGHFRKYDRHNQVSWRMLAHEGKALTSAFIKRAKKSLYVTGGNDSTIAIWDVSDCVAAPGGASKTTNEQMIECLKRFVSYKTVSSDARYKDDCRRGASYLRSVFKSFGAVTEMLPTDNANNPVILARFRGNPTTSGQRKKILFYGHYDVVAAENENGRWNSDPFTMLGINGYLHGRGTSDNKGPIVAAIFACAELTTQQALGSDIIFLIEGEEECGSRGFAETIRKHKNTIGDIDWILLANSYWLDDRIPCLTYGLRGVIHVTVQVDSDHPDLHSGVDGSAKLDESLKDLVALLSRLSGKQGQVQIPGFYDPIPALTSEEGSLYKDITDALLDANPALGDSSQLAASLMRRWRDPSLTIHRFQTSGPDNATIIPRTAKAALSIRLVPNQTAGEVGQNLIDFLNAEFEKFGSHNRLTVTIDHQAEPWLGDVHNEIFKTLEEAVMDVWTVPEPPKRRLSKGGDEGLRMSMEAGDFYIGTRAGPTTSNALANGSAAPTKIPGPRSLSNGDELLLREEHKEDTGYFKGASMVKLSPRKGRKPLYIREGGSISAIRFLELEFNAPAAHLPCGQASDSAHLDNERLRLVNLYKSKDIFYRVFRDLPRR